MDSLLENLANIEVTSHSNNPNAEHPYFSLYKKKNVANQEDRRQKILEVRKEKRYDLLMHLRNIEEKDNENKADDEMCVDEHKSVYVEPREYNNFVMLSEWLVDVPENFKDNYLALLCPVGKRCLCVSYQGQTRIYAKDGKLIRKFWSVLPGGSRKTAKQGLSILDCIYSYKNRIFYIIDLVYWHSLSLLECETSFRFTWLQSRIKESDDDVTTISHTNIFRFIPAPYYDCSDDSLTKMFSDPFLEEVELDGILFYNKLTHYTHGPTPLVCWLKGYMLPEILNINVPEKFMSEKPVRYTNLFAHIEEANQKKKQKSKADTGKLEEAKME